MSRQQIVLLIIFVSFLSVCFTYVIRTSRRQRAKRHLDTANNAALEAEQARVEGRPSSR